MFARFQRAAGQFVERRSVVNAIPLAHHQQFVLIIHHNPSRTDVMGGIVGDVGTGDEGQRGSQVVVAGVVIHEAACRGDRHMGCQRDGDIYPGHFVTRLAPFGNRRIQPGRKVGGFRRNFSGVDHYPTERVGRSGKRSNQNAPHRATIGTMPAGTVNRTQPGERPQYSIPVWRYLAAGPLALAMIVPAIYRIIDIDTSNNMP